MKATSQWVVQVVLILACAGIIGYKSGDFVIGLAVLFGLWAVMPVPRG